MGAISDLNLNHCIKTANQLEELLQQIQQSGHSCDPESAIEVSWGVRELAHYWREGLSFPVGPLVKARLEAFR